MIQDKHLPLGHCDKVREALPEETRWVAALLSGNQILHHMFIY